MLERYLTGASTYAQSIDHLILLIAVIVGFWFFAAEIVFFGLIFKFRRREGQPTQFVTGEEKHLKRWVSTPHLLVVACDVIIIVAATKVWIDIKQTMPPAERTIRVFGQQFSWTFQDPGPDGVLDTPDDIRTVDEIHVKVDTNYRFEVESRDVVHSFCVPSFRLKQDAVPGRTIVGWFRPTRTGTYDIQCTQMCGIGHGFMAGRMIVDSPEQHAAWVAHGGNASTAALQPAETNPAAPAASALNRAPSEVRP